MVSENSNLGACHVCKHTVSRKAKTCPNCGQGKPYKEWQPPLQFRVKTYVIIFLILALPMFMKENTGTQSNTTATPASSNARQLCIDAIKATVNNPSTLDIHRVSGYGSKVSSDGTTRITQTFSAKNGFGLEKTYDAYCTVSPAGKLDFKVIEQGR